MILRELLDQDFVISCPIMIDCDTSRRGNVNEVVSPAAFDTSKVISDYENREIISLGYFTKNGKRGLKVTLESVFRHFDKSVTMYKCVARYYDNGYVDAGIKQEIVSEIPKDTSEEKEKYDEYTEWFDTYPEAIKWKEDCENA